METVQPPLVVFFAETYHFHLPQRPVDLVKKRRTWPDFHQMMVLGRTVEGRDDDGSNEPHRDT